MQETFYFGAGPATLPKVVLANIKNELTDYRNSGLSVLELSHRSDEFFEIRDQAENLLRELMGIPDDYAVLFLHGGATAQYSMIPLNFLHQNESADYICTGLWSTKACIEAQKFGDVNVIQALEKSETISVKSIDDWGITKQSSYIHYCDNETINGVVNDVASKQKAHQNATSLFCDMTSSILTRPIQVNDYDLIYASAQKNLGIAGLCVMILKKELLNKCRENIPSIFDYIVCFKNKSLTNTPPTFAIYVLALMLQWLKQEGGVVVIYKRNQSHAKTLYELMDASVIYKNNVSTKDRSNVNIPFDIQDKSLQNKFLQQAEKNKLLGLRGHKSVGGVRISLYNAIPQQGVVKLLEFMRDFECGHG
jgi:phosphoserine aminotransferase